MKSKRLIPLSVQEIVDCGWRARYPNGYSDEGWYGAVVLDLKLLLRGLESEETYPYHGMKKKGDRCHYDLVNFENPIVTYVTGVKYALGEGQTAELLQEGPLANGINARARSFQFYSKGMYKFFLLHHWGKNQLFIQKLPRIRCLKNVNFVENETFKM